MRTIEDHHRMVERVTARVLAAFDRGARSVEIPTLGGWMSVRRIRDAEIPPEDGPRLCLEWMTYFEVDRLIRRVCPFDEPEL